MHRHATPEQVGNVGVAETVERDMGQLGGRSFAAERLGEMRRVDQLAIRPVRKDEIHLAEPQPETEAGMLFALCP